MKKLKTAAAIFVAATMAVGAMAVSSFAEGSTHKLYVKAEAGSVGDIVPVSVVLDSTKDVGVGGISFKLNYNPEELELQEGSAKAGSALATWSGDINTKQVGSVGFAYTVNGAGVTDTNVEMLSLSFKVLKLNSSITLTDIDIAADDEDGTDINDSVSVVSEEVVKCSHKNTEVKTEIEDCEKGGKATTTCKDCGEIVKTEDVAATDHKVDKWTETKKATCTAEGEEEGTCTVCGKTVTRATAKIDHTVEWTVTKEATCTEAGTKEGTCSVCSEKFTEEIPALGHSFGEWTTVKEPTTTEKGSEERVCSVCGEKETRELPVKEEPAITTDNGTGTTTDNGTGTTTDNGTGTTAPGTTNAAGNVNGATDDKNSPDTGVAGVTAVAALAAVAGAAVIIAKKRK